MGTGQAVIFLSIIFGLIFLVGFMEVFSIGRKLDEIIKILKKGGMT